MIEAREIRKCNKVFDNNNEIVEVEEIRKAGIIVIDYRRDMFLFYEEINGIPLTPEILKKCGGKKVNRLPFYEIVLKMNVGSLHINPDIGMIWLRHPALKEFGINPMSTNPAYLHQLQNLYFFLCGEELQINL